MARWVERIARLASETRRRSVFKVATVYAVSAYGASMGAAEILPAFGAPDWSVRAFILAAVLGLPLAIALAWAYEITPRGIVRDGPMSDLDDTGRKAASMTTVLFGAQGLVHVSWFEGSTRHDRTFVSAFKMGRDAACDIHFDDPMVSRQHAQVTFEDGHWWISDLGSRNGTMVQGRQVRRIPLPARCEVRLYEAGPTLTIELKSGSSAATLAPVRTESA